MKRTYVLRTVQYFRLADTNMGFKCAMLPTVEMAKKIPERLRVYGRNWWLRSIGGEENKAATVNADGEINVEGEVVNISLAVRPLLYCKSHLPIGTRFLFGGIPFEIITEEWAFCVECVKFAPFNNSKDGIGAYSYHASSVRRLLDKWFESVLKECGQPVI